MRGYETEVDTIEHVPQVVEDKVVIGFDEERGWTVERTTVTEMTVHTTTRSVRRAALRTYRDAERVAKADHSLPTYVRGDDRQRAQDELEAVPAKKG